jgi:uncharacterized protein (DUF1697 family)
MTTWIAFFRGINVGGRNILPMKELQALLSEIGCVDVVTYIQSGNVVFRHKGGQMRNLSKKIRQAVLDRFHFEPHVLLMSVKDLQSALLANPFPAAAENPKTLHLFFLSSVPTDVDIDDLQKIKSTSENFELIEQVFYLHAPELAARAEKLLGVPATGRNWRTAQKVLELAG